MKETNSWFGGGGEGDRWEGDAHIRWAVVFCSPLNCSTALVGVCFFFPSLPRIKSTPPPLWLLILTQSNQSNCPWKHRLSAGGNLEYLLTAGSNKTIFNYLQEATCEGLNWVLVLQSSNWFLKHSNWSISQLTEEQYTLIHIHSQFRISYQANKKEKTKATEHASSA